DRACLHLPSPALTRWVIRYPPVRRTPGSYRRKSENSSHAEESSTSAESPCVGPPTRAVPPAPLSNRGGQRTRTVGQSQEAPEIHWTRMRWPVLCSTRFAPLTSCLRAFVINERLNRTQNPAAETA